MSTTNETAPSTENARGRDSNNTSNIHSSHSRAAHKWQRTLAALLNGPKNSFELEKHPTFDHCPNSTVSELKKRHGLVIHAQLVRVAGYNNAGAMIAEYRLADSSRAKALKLVEAGQ